MKKKILLLIVAIIAIALTGCGGEKGYHEVKIDELGKMIKDKESFVLVIGSETCSACEAYKPTMEKVITTYNVRVNYINIYPLKDEEKAELLSYVYYNSTPTTVFFEEGVASGTHNRITGAESYDKVVEMLKKNGYIK